MVTFYRKAQLKTAAGSSASGAPMVQPITKSSGYWSEPEYLGVVNPEDELPYVMVRPKINRKNQKKVLRMRSHWD